jgi:hypothetical protein
MSRIQLSLAVAVAYLLLPGLLCAGDNLFLSRGTKELGISGTIYVTHDSPEDLFGVITLRGGYYFARNHQAGIDATVFAYSRIQDTYLSGYYRYLFAGERRIAPFLGASIGSNISHFDYVGSQHSLITCAEAGIRHMISGKFAFDLSYKLMYRKDAAIGFTGTTSSVLTFGFARTF